MNRKVWGGNRTWVGARAQGVPMSVLETYRRTGRSGLKFVSRALRALGNPLLPTPALLTPAPANPVHHSRSQDPCEQHRISSLPSRMSRFTDAANGSDDSPRRDVISCYSRLNCYG